LDEKPDFIGIAALLRRKDQLPQLSMLIRSSSHDIERQRTYGGPPSMAPQWSMNTILNLIRLTFFESGR
jgi:hypothetical protein